jgi:hypothetical protein
MATATGGFSRPPTSSAHDASSTSVPTTCASATGKGISMVRHRMHVLQSAWDASAAMRLQSRGALRPSRQRPNPSPRKKHPRRPRKILSAPAPMPEMQLPPPSIGVVADAGGDDAPVETMLCRHPGCMCLITATTRLVCAACGAGFCLLHAGRCVGCRETICSECFRTQVCRNVFRSLSMRGPAVASRTWAAVITRARQCTQCQAPCPYCTTLSVADGGVGCNHCGRTMCARCLSAAGSWTEIACDSCYERVLHGDRECAISLLLLG